MKEINITTKEDQIKIARGFSDKIGIELNNLKKDFGSYFKQYGSINEKHISDKKLEIKKSVGNLLSQVLQDEGLNVRVEFNPNDEDHPYKIISTYEANDSLKKILEKKNENLKEKLDLEFKSGINPENIKNLQVRLGLNNKQISAIESLIKKITPEELKKNEIAINDQFKNLNKSINSAVNDYAGQINTKGKIEKDEANHKAKINAVCGTLLTVLAVAAFIFVGATLALTLPALLAFVGAIFITQGAMILGTAGGLVTWLSKEKERDKGEAKINNIIDTLPDQLNNLSNNLNSIGESIKTCTIDTEKVRIEAKMEDEKGKIKPSATPDTSKSGGISQSK